MATTEKPADASDLTVGRLVGRRGVLCIDTSAGRHEFPCRVIGETRMKYRIVVDTETRLPRRTLSVGERVLVPRWSVRFPPPKD